MKMPVEKIETWIEVLRSGLYKQTKGKLQDHKGFCCLGVACDIFISEQDIERSYENFLVGSVPGSQEDSPSWLKVINWDFDVKTSKSLTGLNDDGGFTFDEIADLLQAVYIEKVLD